ncbi:class I SAM-dependent methyltransferase [Paraflavitalea pollutisoli]|uniref:class I SAM-dependent methyltransferase n=1 Tax=Paraflavitalea pollutisoli TaxID=3034143 RepID=UPI0023EBEA62|nr:class I SAM-dependent methyltransferase [Paraflavitalea sp. H1-2-19X]
MFEFHADRKRYFDIQRDNTVRFVIPFIERGFTILPGQRVLEIGCGEAGVLFAFLERGCTGVGVEFDATRLVHAAQWTKDYVEAGKVKYIDKDIYKVEVEELGGKFDIIILKDVIEHIHDQPKLIAEMKRLLTPNGVIFFGFPPWQMPFGGHQQICKNKWLSKLPWYHLLPRGIYRYLLTRKNENVEEMMEIRDTQITIERFEKIVRQTGYRISAVTHYLINPIYEYKFGWKPRQQFAIIRHIPWVRNFVTTCVYYLITPEQK